VSFSVRPEAQWTVTAGSLLVPFMGSQPKVRARRIMLTINRGIERAHDSPTLQ
jgi:hypothetical protein